MKKLRACGVLLTRGDGVESFLLLKHADRLDLPKGHVDPGEDDIQCALREMSEETGISADDIELDPDFRYVHQYTVCYERTGNEQFEKTLVIFHGHLKRDIPIVLSEHEGYEWIPWNPPHKIQAQTIDPLLAYLASHLNSQG